MESHKRQKITKLRLDKLSAREIIWDAEVRGFNARKNTDGTVSFRLKTRVKTQQRHITIGKFGVWTVEAAREEAATLCRAAAAGEEPRPDKLRGAEKPQTLAQAAETFLAQYGNRLKPRTKDEYERKLKFKVLPFLGKRTVESIVAGDVHTLHERLGHQKRTANFAIAVLSKLLTWTETRGWRPKNSNPCRGVQRFKEQRRNRYLSSTEAQRLGEVLVNAAAEGSESPYVLAAIRMLIFTGARRNEILQLRWENINWERRCLDLPDSKTGAKCILLNRHALQVLRQLAPVSGNPYVFVGNIKGACLVNIAKPWERIRTAAQLPSLRLHDLRHSFGNRAIDAGGSTRVLGVLLGHSQEETTARYAHVATESALRLVDATGELIAQSMQAPEKRPALAELIRVRPLHRRFRRAEPHADAI